MGFQSPVGHALLLLPILTCVKYFAPFKAAIRAGALSLMVNSANNSGVAFHANKELLTG